MKTSLPGTPALSDPPPRGFLAQCEKEPLHQSGAIQPHGVLWVLSPEGTITHASANIQTLFGQPVQPLMGQPAPAEWQALARAVPLSPGSRKTWLGLEPPSGVGKWDVTISRAANTALVVECVPHVAFPPVHEVTEPVHRLSYGSEEELQAGRQALVDLVAQRTGFLRVMYYQFRPDGHGEVMAEARQSEAYGSYLGLRFPASDIPQVARHLYTKNPWRLIADAMAEPIEVFGEGQQVPDLTWSDLRSVSPIHRIYLGNMGVRASLSFPVTVGGQLIALVTAHHQQSATPALGLLEKLAGVVHTHTLALSAYQSHRRMKLLDSLSHRFTEVQQTLHRHGNLISAWTELGPWLQQTFTCDGAVLQMEGTLLVHGLALEPQALAALNDWWDANPSEFVWLGDSLTRQVPGYPLSSVSGALCVKVGRNGPSQMRLCLTRTEVIEHVTWGGNPDKPVEHHDGQWGIAPRRSFEKWIETRMGQCLPWDNESRLLALRLRELLQKELFP